MCVCVAKLENELRSLRNVFSLKFKSGRLGNKNSEFRNYATINTELIAVNARLPASWKNARGERLRRRLKVDRRWNRPLTIRASLILRVCFPSR